MPEEGTRPLPVEIEMRARFDEEAHDRLVARLEQEGS